MTQRNRTTDRRVESGATNDSGSGRATAVSRRTFLQTSAVVGASALTLAGSVPVTAQSVADENCDTEYGTLLAGENEEFHVINNAWTDPSVDQCVYLYDDGSYGWEWATRTSDGEPNYPEVLVGNKPWGTDTGAPMFPIQRGDVDEMEIELDVDMNISGGEWNLAEEWWLTSDQPEEGTESDITHEIMLVLEWSDAHSHGGVIEENATTDAYGNQIDYWANYDIDWDFHIFRIAANQTPAQVDLTAVMDYMTEQVGGVNDSHWITGIEIGNEYWQGVSGDTHFHTFDATVNGETASSGSGSSDGNGNGNGNGNGGDDLIYDIDGNGETTPSDVTEFFDGFQNEYSDPGSYDFDGNGDVTTADVVSLFESL